MANTSGDLNMLFVCAVLFGLFDDDTSMDAPPSTEPGAERQSPQPRRHPSKE